MKNLKRYNKDRLLDLLEETRKKCNSEKRKLGLKKFKLHLIKKWADKHPHGLCSENNGMIVGEIKDDGELEKIVQELINTYRDPEKERLQLLDKVIMNYENKIVNSTYKIKQLKDTIKIVIEKIKEIDSLKESKGD